MGVLVVAYNAQGTLASVLDRLPASFLSTVEQVLVCDDASTDATHEIGLAYQATSDLPVTIVRHPYNLGYGGNQKSGYRLAISLGLDVVVLLHGDGQYAPEVIENLVAPLVDGSADAVFGSRMMSKGAARSGGMPLYKYVGNRILTTAQNALVGLSLSEWHSGYRAYRVDALADLPFESYSDGFDFDTEIILGMHEAHKHIVEVPIPTYYGDEICYVDGMRYARDVMADVVRHRLRRLGFGAGEPEMSAGPYELKTSPHSSHGVLLSWLAETEPGSVLDVGCSDGRFGELVRGHGHRVVGVDVVKHEGVGERLDGFIEADLNVGLPDETGVGFDVIVAADVLEHTIDPARCSTISPAASLLTDRSSSACPTSPTGTRGHGWRSVGSTTTSAVCSIAATCASSPGAASSGCCGRTGWPSSGAPSSGRRPSCSVARGRRWRPDSRGAGAVDRAATGVWPTLFAYQFLYELTPT